MNKYAITTLLFGDKKYIVGAIISAYLHKLFIEKYNLKIDLTIMLAEDLIEYKTELEKYYDKIYVVKLYETKISEKTDLRRYTKIMKFLPNKAQMFNLVDYEKVLFTDIDFLPIKKDFYDIFNLKTPAYYSVEHSCNEFNQVIDKNIFINLEKNKKNAIEKNYNQIIKNMKKSINATLMLIKPSTEDYKKFMFVKELAEKNGGIHTKFNVDEILILTFTIFTTEHKIHCIPRKYRTKAENLNNNVLGINFASSIKPWFRFPMLQWTEENIWHIIAKKALKNSDVITNIYITTLIDNLINYSQNYLSKGNLVGYNNQIVKTKGKDKLLVLINYVLSINLDNKKNIDNIKYIMKESQDLHSYIDTKINKNFYEIENLLKN
jgi:hypothetical protein